MQQNLEHRFPKPLRTTSIWSTLVAMSVACILLLSACGGPNASQPTNNQAKKGGNLKVGLIAEPTVLDPLTSVSLYDSDITANIYDPLFRYDANGQLQDELASSYSYASPTVLNLTLRTGVKFQDGTPFNADAVIFNINRFRNDKASPRYTDVADIDSLVKISDSQVQIRLAKPFAPFLTVLSGAVGTILSPTAVQKLGKTLGNAPINAGSGPFIFKEWIKGDHLTLTANPNYWKKDANGVQLPYLASIRYQTITDGTVMYTNLQTGTIQVATGIAPNDVALIKSNPSLTYKQVSGPGFGSLFLDTATPPMDNVHVRRAIAWGINRQEILDHVLNDIGVVSKGPISPVNFAYDKNIQSYTYNVDKAKAELALSGLSNVTFTLKTQSGSPVATQEAQFIQSELQPVGITVNIQQETFTAEVQDVQTFKYQAAAIGWTGGPDPDNDMYLLFKSDGGFNYTKYNNPQVDMLLDEGRTTTDQAKRIAIYQQAQQLIVNDSPFIFIDHGAVSQETASTVKNYFLSPSGVLYFRDVYLSN